MFYRPVQVLKVVTKALLQSAGETARSAWLGSAGLSGRLELKPLAVKLDRLGQERDTKTKGAVRRCWPRRGCHA